jgi:hypothetical protein
MRYYIGNPGLKYVLIAALFSLTSSAAYAYEIKRTPDGAALHWEQPIVNYFIDYTVSNLDPTTVKTAIQNGFNCWDEVETAGFNAAYAGTAIDEREGYSQSGNNTNIIRFEEENFLYDDSILAITLMTYNVNTGAILDGDIVFNGVSYAFSNDGTPGTHDIENTLAHEAGHFAGLAHSDEHEEATMYPLAIEGESNKRTLSSDDIRGISFLYPIQSNQPNPGTDLNNSSTNENTNQQDVLLGTEYNAGSVTLDNVEYGIGCSQTGRGSEKPLTSVLLLAVMLLAITRRES